MSRLNISLLIEQLRTTGGHEEKVYIQNTKEEIQVAVK